VKFVRRLALLAFFALTAFAAAPAQVAGVHLKIHAVLVDKDLNQKPVPHLTLTLQRTDAPGEPVAIKTGFDGSADATLPPGKYKLTTAQPVDFQGKHYQWELNLDLSSADVSLELSNDNAKVTENTPEAAAHPPADELSTQFKRLQSAVVTVYSEFGHGTGFIVDPNGLVITNDHVVEKSEYLAVQFDEKRKVNARLLASDSQKDIAVLWVNLAACSEAVVAPIAKTEVAKNEVAKNETGKSAAIEGDRVFTIGSPLTLRKVLTTGVVSRVEPKSIISDININPGNSGGPLFNSAGLVIGVTTFNQQARSGPGLSGIVRIEEALPLVEQARSAMKASGATMPSAALLPVEPKDPFPLDALRASVPEGKVNSTPYIFTVGDFDVMIITPPLEYRFFAVRQKELEKEREKRNKKRGDNETEKPEGASVKNWEADEHKPEITIRVEPQLKVKFWATMAAPKGQVKARFKTDFYRMRLLCGTSDVTPILPAKYPLVGGNSGTISISDTTFMGLYDFLPESIAPACGPVTLEIYPDKGSPPVVKVLEQTTIQAVWTDFEPYRKSQVIAPPVKN
jgi:S1-C subfamily serine protease